MQNQNIPVDLSGLPTNATGHVGMFVSELVSSLDVQLESITITGSCLTGDYIQDKSDINSVLVLKDITLPVLELLGSLGKRYGKKRIKAPLMMTREYISSSLDVFPIEFLDIKLIHKTIYGEDVFSSLEIDDTVLRLQCEHDLKAKLINLRQAYISCAGKTNLLTGLLLDAFPGYFPLFRAMLYLVQTDKHLPILKTDVLADTESLFDIHLDVLREIQSLRSMKRAHLSHEEAGRIFNEVYRITHEFSLKMDTLSL